MSDLNVCDTKIMYDTQFEAEIAAAKVTYKKGTTFEPYQCGTHWHLTHKDPTLRRGVGKKYWRCPKCKQIAKRGRAHMHKCDITRV